MITYSLSTLIMYVHIFKRISCNLQSGTMKLSQFEHSIIAKLSHLNHKSFKDKIVLNPFKMVGADYTFLPNEITDWNYARNCRSVLRQHNTEWSQSLFTVEISDFGGKYYIPNRDFTYEGLTHYKDGENWKYMENMAFGLKKDNSWLDLEQHHVKLTPYSSAYIYNVLKDNTHIGQLTVSYYLGSESEDATTGKVSYNYDGTLDNVTLSVSPLVDIRHMYGGSSPDAIKVDPYHNNSGLNIHLGEKTLLIRGDNVSINKNFRYDKQWEHKLGSGFRKETYQGVMFKKERTMPSFRGLIETDLNDTATLLFSASNNGKDAHNALTSFYSNHMQDEKNTIDSFANLASTLGLDLNNKCHNTIAARAYGLLSFGISINDTTIPEAGGWWFKNAWFRDVYEGILNNYTTYSNICGVDYIKDVVETTLALQNDSGRVPNKMPEFVDEERHYTATDATLLTFLTGLKVAEDSGDKQFANKLISCIKKSVDAFHNSDLNAWDGSPKIMSNGLLASVAWHTWTDSKRELFGKEFPERISASIQMDLIESEGMEAALQKQFSPQYYLPEINAQWINVLEGAAQLAHSCGYSDVEAEFKGLYDRASAYYKTVFWNKEKGFLYNAVDITGQIDTTVESTAVVAAAMLGNKIFSDKELLSIYSTMENRLVQRRDGKRFGIIVADTKERIYYGDEQYHEAVIWPRDTPYVIKLLEHVGKTDEIKEYLDSNLAHQMDEQAIFYNNELFSLPEGKNPSPTRRSHQPVPVKNPIQFWSQWVDPYLKYLKNQK